MSVKILTDSTSDLSPEVANELGITVVPGYIRFGEKVYRDGVDITSSEIYEKMKEESVHPTTSEPTPEDFARVYSYWSKQAESILSIHISSKMSRIYESAVLGKNMAKGATRIEIINSNLVSAGLALVVVFAAKLANARESFESVFDKTQAILNQVYMMGIFSTMKGLVFSDRVGAGITALADIANVKPLLTIEEGVLTRAGLVRTYSEGVEKLYQFVENNLPKVQDLAITYSVALEQATEFKKRLGNIFPEENIYIAQLGAALGVHAGSGALVAALRCDDK